MVDSSQTLADATRSAPQPVAGAAARQRRISYFMLFRLAVLVSFTALAAGLTWWTDRELDPVYNGFVVGTPVVGFVLTIVFAYLLPRVRDLDRFTSIQTTVDILLVTVVMQMSGGAGSGFASLYLIAVLGAATMGGGRQTWAAAGTCALIYGSTCLLEGLEMLEPLSEGKAAIPLSRTELVTAYGRTLAGLLGVTVLSTYLDKQLAWSTQQVGDLRAMNENILRSLTSGLVGVDNERRVIYWNPAARGILGLEDGDLRRPVDELLPGVEAQLSPVSEPDAIEGRGRWELEVRTRSGSSLHLGMSRSRLLDGKGQPIGQLINFQDVTRMHELAEQVRRSERLAAVGGLAASVAHEIRNPLAAISGSAELLGSTALQDEDTRLLSIIRRESTRLSDLVTDMLAFTRPRPPHRARVSLPRLAREAVEHFRADPHNQGLQLEVRGEDVPDVEVDAAQLTQVLWNLLRNAAEAMSGRGLVTLDVRSDCDAVVLSVGDEGPGIPADRLERIFDPFFTTKERGTGFGLAIVYRIVQDNGGTIEVSSTPGEGTIFRLRFAALSEV